MSKQISPLPWREAVRGPNNMPVIGSGNVMIAHVCTGVDFQDEADANAAFIVKAVNSHDALVAALREALATIDDYLSYTHSGDPWEEDSRAMGEMDIDDYSRDGRMEKARSALAQAEAA